MVMFSGHLYKLLQPITVSCKIQNPNSGKQGREAEPACLDSCASYCRCLLEPNKTIYCFKGFISPPCPRFFIARDFLWLWRASVPRLYTLCCHYAQCCSPIVIVMLCCLVGDSVYTWGCVTEFCHDRSLCNISNRKEQTNSSHNHVPTFVACGACWMLLGEIVFVFFFTLKNCWYNKINGADLNAEGGNL